MMSFDIYEDELVRLNRKTRKKDNQKEKEKILFQLLAFLHSKYPVIPDEKGDYAASYQELEHYLNARLAYFSWMPVQRSRNYTGSIIRWKVKRGRNSGLDAP